MNLNHPAFPKETAWFKITPRNNTVLIECEESTVRLNTVYMFGGGGGVYNNKNNNNLQYYILLLLFRVARYRAPPHFSTYPHREGSTGQNIIQMDQKEIVVLTILPKS